MEKIFSRAAEAGRRLSLITPEKRDALLLALADRLENRAEDLLEANAVDLAAMGEDSPMHDRLKLTRERIAGIAADMRAVAALPSPLGRELERRERPNGMLIRKVTVPFGVIGVIYESRPNVTFDVFSLCFKAGSAVVLKGGHEAAETNALAVAIIIDALAEAGLIKADRTPKPIILDFNAVWCGPCQEFAPVFEAAAEKYGDKVDFISVDVDKYQDLSGLMGVESIPNVIVLNADGSLNRNIVGTGDLLPAEKFDAIVTSLL